MAIYDIDGNLINTSAGNQWAGKTWYSYGTSLTGASHSTYDTYAAQALGMTLVDKGISGGALVANRNIYNALMDNTDGKVNADLITIEVGANDGSTLPGDVTSMDTDTFCGALNTCLQNVLSNCPKAQVVLMPSYRQRKTAQGALCELGETVMRGITYWERSELIRKVAVANGIYFIPFDELGMGLFRMQASDLYNIDNIHPSYLGSYNLAQGVIAYLKNIPCWFNAMPS